MSNDPLASLGRYLTATEAEGLAVLLEAGEHTAHALWSVSAARRDRAAELLKTAGIGHTAAELSVAVLRGIAGAKVNPPARRRPAPPPCRPRPG